MQAYILVQLNNSFLCLLFPNSKPSVNLSARFGFAFLAFVFDGNRENQYTAYGVQTQAQKL